MKTYPAITPEIIQEIQNIRTTHSMFLNSVKERFGKIYEDNKTIFRRAPETPRIKTMESILGHVTDINQTEIIKCVEELPDIAGARMTITTKDEIEIAQKILQAELKQYGELDMTSRKNNGVMNVRGYTGYHYYLSSKIWFNNREYKVTLEIQIRTLAQDTWAVFEHPERYKSRSAPGKDHEILGAELLNYAQLMDVADEIAKLIKNRKKMEAETYCKEKRISNHVSADGKNLLDVEKLNEQLVRVLLAKQSPVAIALSSLCDILILLCDSNVHTIEDLTVLLSAEAFVEIKKHLKNEDVRSDQYSLIEMMDMLNLFLLYREKRIKVENAGVSTKSEEQLKANIERIEKEFTSAMKYRIQYIKEELRIKELLEGWEVVD